MNEAFPKFEEKPESLYEAAARLHSEYNDLDSLIPGISRFLVDHAKNIKNPQQPKTIMESRFTPAEEAFEKGMMSCGSITNIASEILKSLGYEVKFIHGELEGHSVDHAWISVKNPEDNSWKMYDLTQPDGSITENHTVKNEIDSWDEIKDQIENDHATLRERQIAKGLIKE